ncbi:MAG: DNA polymerase III subunit gamma/tau [Rhodospirillales bacterium]
MAGTESSSPSLSADSRWRVLARKYRPSDFSALIGQEALVRTLSNAFAAGRIAHAYMLAGVRGVGKTTTARIIARALNCVGADGNGGVTISPCGVCEQCVAIAEDRHLDVVEMDAASHTGVDNIRELLDGVPYRPALARFKVYIIDEVHMLSEKAFNALLKTLEEPPEHVKFIFATTEVRKVPVTVLSRCQRFDLRRIEGSALEAHLGRIAEREQVAVTPAALRLLARAADGSVRDSLSLLDQAIAHGGGAVEEQAVREMLGLADRAVCLDLLDDVLRGDVSKALAILAEQYACGADPLTIVEDLLELTHWLTRLKLAPAAAAELADDERRRGAQMAELLPMAALTRTWQMLLKGLGEMRMAPSPLHAAEMLIIRIAYASGLPSPADALAALAAGSSGGDGSRPPAAPRPGGHAASAGPRDAPGPRNMAGHGQPAGGRGVQAAAHPEPSSRTGAAPMTGAVAVAAASPRSFAEVVELARRQHEGLLCGDLESAVHLVRFEPGQIELRLAENAPADLPQRLSRWLLAATGRHWMVGVSRDGGGPTLLQQRESAQRARLDEAAQHPLVRSILQAFPGAVLDRVRSEDPPAAADAEGDALVTADADGNAPAGPDADAES